MKVQMKFQKILVTVSLILAALTIVSTIIFPSGNLAGIQYYRYETVAEDVCNSIQSYVKLMLVLTIVYLCTVLVLYITDTNKRRNYYITNYIASGLAIAGSFIAGVAGIIFTTLVMSKFYGMDWTRLEALIPVYVRTAGSDAEVSKAPTMFIISYVTSLLALADAVAIILNLVWKIKLMKGEKLLLEQGLLREVA